MKIEKLPFSVRWMSAVFLAGVIIHADLGCITGSVTPQSAMITGAPIGGTDDYVVRNVTVRAEACGTNEHFIVGAEGEHRWKVAQTEKKWDAVTRERLFAVVGVHSNYSAVNDLVLEPVAVAVIIGFSPYLLPEMFLKHSSASDNKVSAGRVFLIFSSLLLAPIPGLCWTPLTHGGAEETIMQNVRLSPGEAKIERVAYKVPLGLRVLDARGNVIKTAQVESGGNVDAAVCDPIFKDMSHPVIRVEVTPENAKVEGTNTFDFVYDVRTLIERTVKSFSGSGSIPSARFVTDAPQLSGRRPDGKVPCGADGKISFRVSNEGPGDGYHVRGEVLSCTGAWCVTNSCDVLLLRAGDGWLIDMPFSIPVRAGEGAGTVRAVVRDALGRQSEPVTVAVAYAARPLPMLQVTDAVLTPCDGESGVCVLEVKLRNRGEGGAEDVRVAVTCENGAEPREREQSVGGIEPFSRGVARLRVKIPAGGASAGSVLKIKVRATERFGVGNTTADIEAAVP